MSTTSKKLSDDDVADLIHKGKSNSTWYSVDGMSDHDAGALWVRVTAAGSKTYYFRCSTESGRRSLVRIGPAGREGRNGTFTVKMARKRRDDLRTRRSKEILASGTVGRDIGAILKSEEAERRAAEEAIRLEASATLEALATAYWEYLKAQGRPSHKDAKNVLKNHVIDAHPALARRRADSITPDDVRTILAKLKAEEKTRTAGKVRSFLAAAYSLGVQREGSEAINAMKITTNPARDTKAIPVATRKRPPLSETELRLLVKKIGDLSDGPVKSALRLCLLLAGQRPEQLLRVKVADVDRDAHWIRLEDRKGRGRGANNPRLHDVPLAGEALEIVNALCARTDKMTVGRGKAKKRAEYLFTVTGSHSLEPGELSRTVHDISAALVASKKIRTPFQMRDIRSTCETELAALGVSKDIRGQLLSHGLGGIQDQRYDRHSYANEKREALAKWVTRLGEIETKKTGAE